MTASNVVLTGTVICDVTAGPEQDSYDMARFRMAVPTRRYDSVSGTSSVVAVSHYTVVCWREMARRVQASILRGDQVIVAGKLRVRDWHDQASGRRGTVAEVSATAIGRDVAAIGTDARCA